MQIDNIPKEEVLRYLRFYKKHTMPDEVDALVEEALQSALSIIRPKVTTRQFAIRPVAEGVALEGTDTVLLGKGIQKHLEGCSHCVLLAATLGHEFDAAVRTLQVKDMTRAVLLDSCGSAAIEEVLDQFQATLDVATNRFSPGYSDLPLSLQPFFLEALDAGRKIGLTLSAGGSLVPRKSVTAVLGVKKQ